MKNRVKSLFALSIVGALFLCAVALLDGCQRSVPPVPQSNRQVVPPKGSTDITKPWNHLNKLEGDAVLGPLSEMRR